MDENRTAAGRMLVAITALAFALPQPVSASQLGDIAAGQVSESSYRYFLGDDQGVPGILYPN